ncbi:hypothetical protein KA005_79475, partial [bacterium]|nr:hypothetical protein [bacterium]
CVSSTNVFTGCPGGAIQLDTTAVTDIGAYNAADRRILFRRGDSWTSSATINLNVSGLTIGAYGTCTSPDARGICSNAPTINATGGGEIFSTNGLTDSRIMDLNFVDVNNTRANIVRGISGMANILHFRLKSSNFGTPISYFHSGTNGHDQLAFVDNDLSTSRVYSMYTGSERLIILGNRLRDPDQSHVLRVWQAYKGVIAHNELSGASATSNSGRQALKLHGPDEGKIADPNNLDNRTQYVLVADNLVGRSGPWPMSIGPKDGGSDERLQDIVVENNRFYPGFGTKSTGSLDVQIALNIYTSYATVRNNVFSGEGSSAGFRAIRIIPSAPAPAPTGNRVFNNTIYKELNPTGNTTTGIDVLSGSVDTEVRNNLVHFATGFTARIAVDDNGTNTVQSNNLLTDASLLVDPDNSDFLAKDFRLVLSSPAVNAGTNVPVFKD